MKIMKENKSSLHTKKKSGFPQTEENREFSGGEGGI